MAARSEGLLRGREPGRKGPPAWSRQPIWALLAVAVACSGALLLVLGAQLTFFLDDWEFLLYRRGFSADAILAPHGEHISVGPVLVYKALLETFGMASALPFRVVSTAMFLLSAVLLFIYLRRRVDQWLALVATVVLLFLGAAWEDLLWPFQIGYFTSMATGLGALLALDRGDRGGDRLACLLLLVSVLFSSLGLPFAVGVAVLLLCDPGRWRRIYVVLVPLAVFAAWWLGWGHAAESHLSLTNLATMPQFVLNGLAGSLASLLGLATPYGTPAMPASPGGLDWGRPLLVTLTVLAAWRLHRLGRASPWLLATVAILGAFWILGGINQQEGREPTASRYQYVGAIFVLLVAAELLRGVRVSRGAMAAVVVVAAASVVSNVYFLHQSYKSYRTTSELERAGLGAVEIARDTVAPGFILTEELVDTGYVHVEAAVYLSAADAFGSPAYDPAELAEASPAPRFAADKVLAAALGVNLVPLPATSLPAPSAVPAAQPGPSATIRSGFCARLPGGPSPPLLSLPPEGASIRAGASPVMNIKLRRFASGEFPIEFNRGLAAGRAGEIVIPADRSSMPWRMQLEAHGPTVVCGRG